MSWWKGFAIFGGNCAGYWVPTPHSHQYHRAPECPGSLSDWRRMGDGEESREFSVEDRSRRPIVGGGRELGGGSSGLTVLAHLCP